MPELLPKSRSLALPPSKSHLAGDTIDVIGSIVVVGANGSGKTRLGAWLDAHSPQAAVTHRLAAQKSLTFPPSSPTSSMDIAGNSLFYGYASADATAHHKVLYRWGSKPDTFFQSDYEKLLTFLFTDEFEKSTKYRQRARVAEHKEIVPTTHLDTIKDIWESVLPDRELVIGGGKVEVRSRAGDGLLYNAADMSDGERVIFYLIGQSLAAKPDSILVVDEPELHLHRCLQARLWDAIEAERPDCLFVYLTHDLDFAASRVNAVKLWLRGYENQQWDWCVLDHDGEIPERLLLEILGSRKPVLFVEGDRDSLEVYVYSHVYPGYTVTPCGGAPAVIHATCSFSALKHLHALECSGIIDRDRRDDEEVRRLADRGVSCLDVSEIENLLLDEGVLRVVAESLRRDDADGVIAQVKSFVLDQLAEQAERVTSAIAASQMESRFRAFDAKAKGEDALSNALADMAHGIDVGALYRVARTDVEAILARKDYQGALRVLDNKGLIPQVAGFFGLKSNELDRHIKRLVAAKDAAAILEALRAAAPRLSPARAVMDEPKVEEDTTTAAV